MTVSDMLASMRIFSKYDSSATVKPGMDADIIVTVNVTQQQDQHALFDLGWKPFNIDYLNTFAWVYSDI